MSKMKFCPASVSFFLHEYGRHVGKDAQVIIARRETLLDEGEKGQRPARPKQQNTPKKETTKQTNTKTKPKTAKKRDPKPEPKTQKARGHFPIIR